MEEIIINFSNAVSTSLQAGDVLYYVRDGVNVRLGPVLTIFNDRRSITVNRNLQVDVPVMGVDYIFFVKDAGIEKSGIIGYEATTTLINTSTSKAELFAVSSEVFESSK